MSSEHPRVTPRRIPCYSGIAPFYDVLVGVDNFRRARRTLEAVAARYGVDFRSAADIGCGTGRFACYLARRWAVPVWAVDRSPAMLSAAARVCRAAGVRLLRQDIRRLRLPAKVDLITATSDTLNHLGTARDFRRALRSIHRNLAPGGHFLFDLVTPWRAVSPGSWMRRVQVQDGCIEHILAWRPAAGYFRTTIVHRRHCAASATAEVHDERAYDPVDVGRWLKQAGFLIRAVLDSGSLAMPHRCPPRVVFLAVKTRPA